MLTLLQHLGAQTGAWFYLLASGLVFAEAAFMVGLIVPGETALLVAGLAAHQGWISLWPMVAIAVCSAVLGDSVGYEVGRRFGPALRSSRLGRLVGEDRWRRTDALLRRYGGRAVLLGRYIAVLRALIPGMAGMAPVPYLRTFLPWNVAGAAIWGPACVLLGYGFAASLTTVGHDLTYGPVALVAIAVAALMIRVHKRGRPVRCR